MAIRWVCSVRKPITNTERTFMRMEKIIRRFAGTFILGSLLLAHYHSQYWLWFTAFVGFNLIQSTFTNFCPLEFMLRKFGVGAECSATEAPPQTPVQAK